MFETLKHCPWLCQVCPVSPVQLCLGLKSLRAASEGGTLTRKQGGGMNGPFKDEVSQGSQSVQTQVGLHQSLCG